MCPALCTAAASRCAPSSSTYTDTSPTSCSIYLGLLLFFLRAIFFYVYACVSICIGICVVPVEAEEGINPSGEGIIDACHTQCGRWEQNSGPLQVQQALIITEPSLQHLGFSLSCIVYAVRRTFTLADRSRQK